MAAFNTRICLKPDIFPDATIPKCEHGQYIGASDTIAYYCRLCWPAGQPPRTKAVILPRSSSDPLRVPDGQSNAKPEHACPECGSTVHFVKDDKDPDAGRTWTCADCGHVFPRPRGALLKAKLEKMRQEAAACLT